MSKIAVFDSQISGISGDMFLSALIDSGADKQRVLDSIYICEEYMEGAKILEANFPKALVKGINATRFLFKYKDTKTSRTGKELLSAVTGCCKRLDLDETTKSFILNSMSTLILAESKIHGESVETVRLHEASSIDTLADLVGSGIAIKSLDLFSSKVYSTPVATGSGLTLFSHGTVPNPTNAVLEIFLNRPFVLTPGYADFETTTPTGAALLVNLSVGSVSRYPDLLPKRIGFGAGSRDQGRNANVTRFVMGESPSTATYGNDTVIVLETSVDDMTGENVGDVIEKMRKIGTKDVTVMSGVSKKNRPNYLIRIITDYVKLDRTLDTLFRETGTLGIRIQETQRLLLDRDIISLKLTILQNEFLVRVKVSKDYQGNLVNIKPEFEDIKKISASLGIPLRIANQIALSEIHTRLGGKYFAQLR